MVAMGIVDSCSQQSDFRYDRRRLHPATIGPNLLSGGYGRRLGRNPQLHRACREVLVLSDLEPRFGVRL
jgi:hypothetical protein